MSRNRIIFLLILLVTALVVALNWTNSRSNSLKQSKDKEEFTVDTIRPVLSKESRVVEFEGSIKSIGKINVSFTVPGTLLPGDFVLEVGKTFRENDILFKLDIYTLFKEISAKKKELKVLAERLHQEKVIDYGPDSEMWDSFTAALLPTKRLPACPSFIKESKNKKVQEFNDAYDEVEKLEAAIEDYYYFAPFSGTVLAVNKKVGEKVLSEACVAQIAPFQIYFVEFKIPNEDAFVLKRKDEVSMIQGNKQLKGRVAKITQKGDGPFSKVECSISSKVSTIGQKVKLQLQRNLVYFFVPYHLVRSNALWIYRSGRSMKIEATILAWKKDAVAIKELKPGDLVLRKSPKSRTISCK